MGGLFKALRTRIDSNAARAVETYTSELPEYRSVAEDPVVQAGMMDFAVLLRRREAELAQNEQPFTDNDLAVLRAYGEQRGTAGVSLLSQQRVLVLHSVLTLREIQEAAGPDDSSHLTRMLGWLPGNGLAAQSAYTEGYLLGQKRFRPATQRMQDFAMALLAGNPAVKAIAASIGMPLATRYLVTVVHVPSEPFATGHDRRDEVLGAVLKRFLTPVTWQTPKEFVALLPVDEDATGEQEDEVADHALALVREFAHLIGRRCGAGAATGHIRDLNDALTLARQISRTAPAEAVPRRLHGISDVFVELGVGHVPQVDAWLRAIAQRLSEGPDLIATLDAFYQHGMNRLNTSGALHIHPRTLDYRLNRIHRLVGFAPGSVQGVRALSTVVTLVLAGTWT
ncbi:hypothetical protein JOF56_008377 [Kibdelosporangium banguiense]|uniref:PucR C-terminal helix-turn-helix domain-containing protein n=1 Tax=Kibdelosporangium banguiense TaxID=1365924 RepID=A0ABS4TUD3_9PSEU|nr:helix-turn-helix domain-containing protein [Kibdelosporangium banguiense]MBP2327992.1 hypothetical protein [Kibdelosporangium banguiense]